MKRKKYPFCILMALCVILFWGTLTVMGYTLGKGGAIVKREELRAEEPKDWETGSETVPGEQLTTEKEEDTSANTEADNSVTDPAPNQDTEGMGQKENTETVTEQEPQDQERSFVQVEMEYLDGALFIGDSRTATLAEYAGWTNTHFMVERGLTIWDVMEEKLAVDSVTGEKISVRDALSREHYEKIYLMLGINELGRGTPDTFYEQYQLVVDEIRSLQPDAVIFIQSIMHVTDGKDQQGTYINNPEVNARNAKIQTLADNKVTFWLDENEVFDAPGTAKLNPDYTNDGVHIKPKFIPLWRDFLLAHGIEINR